jgi:hypothetical protein
MAETTTLQADAKTQTQTPTYKGAEPDSTSTNALELDSTKSFYRRFRISASWWDSEYFELGSMLSIIHI